MRIAKPTKTEVWINDSNGIKLKRTLVIPEGWYALPDPEESK